MLSKKRHLSLNAIEDVAKYLKLSRAEKEFVLYQFLSSPTSEPGARKHFEKVIAVLKEQIRDQDRSTSKENSISESNKAYLFTHLKDTLVATLARRPGFQADATWISKQFTGAAHINQEEAKEILERLFQSGVLKKSGPTGIQVAEDQVHGIHPLEFNVFEATQRMSIEALKQTTEHRPCRFEAGVYSFSAETYEKVLAEVKDLVSRMAAYEKADTGTDRSVYISNFSLVCTTGYQKNESP